MIKHIAISSELMDHPIMETPWLFHLLVMLMMKSRGVDVPIIVNYEKLSRIVNVPKRTIRNGIIKLSIMEFIAPVSRRDPVVKIIKHPMIYQIPFPY